MPLLSDDLSQAQPSDPRELRHETRVELKVALDVKSPTNFFTGIAMNISTGGIFLATHVPARVGEIIPLSFALPDEKQDVHVMSEVCWSRRYRAEFPDAHPGMGLRFLNLLPADAERINRYIHTVREPYFHPGED